MAINRWRGDAQGRAQVSRLTMAAVTIGSRLTLTCNRKDVYVTAESESLPLFYAAIVSALTAARALYAEYLEFTASLEMTGGVATAVLFTGDNDGKPFTVTASAAIAFEMGVVEASKGVAELNEIQQIDLSGSPSSGNYTLTYDGQTTGSIAYNASAGTIQTALEGLSTIGNVAVSGSSPTYTAEFQGALAATNAALLVGGGSTLNGARTTVSVTTEGRAKTNVIYRVTPLVASGVFTSYVAAPGATVRQVAAVSVNASAATLRGAIAVWVGGTGNVLVTKDGADFLVEFTGSLAGEAVTYGALIQTEAATVTIGVEQSASDEGENEVQSLAIEHGPTGGTFTLTYSGQTTSGIAYNANAAAVQSALEGLSNIASGDVEVTGTNPNFAIEFKANLGLSDVPLMTSDFSSLTGSSIAVVVTQESRPGVSETQSIYIDGTPTGGTFRLTFDGQQTGTIAYNASAGTVQTALEALSNIAGSGADITVTGSAGGPWLVTFNPVGAYEFADVVLMTADGASLTGSAVGVTLTQTTSPTGPAWMNDPENWSLNLAPANGQTLVFQDSDRPALYGIDAMDTVTPDAILFYATYIGAVGLPYDTGDYIEYRPRYWRIGANAGSMPIRIGIGEGDGAERIHLDTGGCQVDFHVEQSGDAGDGTPAIRWVGTDAANVAFINRGNVGIGAESGDAATVATLTIGYKEDADGDAVVAVGEGVTVGTINKRGGTLDLACAVGTMLTNTAGTTTIRGEGDVAGLVIEGGRVNYHTSGDLNGNTIVGGGGVLDFAGDMVPKTVANPIDVYGDESEVNDPNCVASTTGFSGALVIDYHQTTRHDQFGRDVRITREAL